jgi:hypothetical protein
MACTGGAVSAAGGGGRLGGAPGHLQRTDQSGVSDGDGLVPLVPPGLGALPRRRRRILVRRQKQEPEVKVGMALGRIVDVDVDEAPALLGMPEVEARLLLRLTKSSIPGSFPGVDVATGLHPPVEAFVSMQDRSPAADDDSRSGHMDEIGLLVEGSGQAVEALEDPRPGEGLTGVGRGVAQHRAPDRLDESHRPDTVPSLPTDTWRHACIPSTHRRPDPRAPAVPTGEGAERHLGPPFPGRDEDLSPGTGRTEWLKSEVRPKRTSRQTGRRRDDSAATGGIQSMGEFSKAFDRFVAADPLELLEANTRRRPGRPSAKGEGTEKTAPGRSQPGMSADSLSRILKTAEGSVVAAGSADVAITKLAQALVRDPTDAIRALRRWGRKAKKDPHTAMGALATFSEVLKRAVALLRCIPQRFGSILEAFKEAAAAVAVALKATSFSITFDLPRTISLAFSWAT